MITTEKQFESDIAAALLSPAGGYTRNGDCYDPKLGLFVDTLIRFVQKTQPNEWAFFEKQNPVNPCLLYTSPNDTNQSTAARRNRRIYYPPLSSAPFAVLECTATNAPKERKMAHPINLSLITCLLYTSRCV